MPATLTVTRDAAGGEAVAKRGKGPERGEQQQQGEVVAHSVPPTLQKDPEFKKFAIVISKCLLQQAQLMSLVMSVVMDCWIGPAESPAQDQSKLQGVTYNDTVKERGRGHGLAPLTYGASVDSCRAFWRRRRGNTRIITGLWNLFTKNLETHRWL